MPAVFVSLLNNNTKFDTVEVVFIRMMYTPLIRKHFSNYGTRALSFWTNLIIVYEQIFYLRENNETFFIPSSTNIKHSLARKKTS